MNVDLRDGCWYVADLVFEFTIEGDARNVVHVNTHLIKAHSPDQAHQKANDLGAAGEHAYANTQGKAVRKTFRGLRDLAAIDDELEDGVELFFEEKVAITEDELRQWIRPREELSIFTPPRARTRGPNYMPDEIMQMLVEEGLDQKDLMGA
jgi:hypothetical protein